MGLTKGTNTNVCANTNIQQTDYICNKNQRSSFADSDSDASDFDTCDIDTSDNNKITNENFVKRILLKIIK